MNEEKQKALEAAIAQIEKQYGKESIMKMDETHFGEVEVIPTGCLPLDIALGVGGLPRGRIVEVYGPESSGKTTVALHVVAEAQRLGGTAAFIDAEHALDPVYASRLGVDIGSLYVSQPDNGEQAMDIADLLIKSGAIDLVIVDSVAALVPQVELDGEITDQQMGLQARLMSKAMRKLAGVLNKTMCTVIFINQLREKVGVMFGNPETTTGGRALKFYSSVRIDVRKKDAIKNGDQLIGNRVTAKVVKKEMVTNYLLVKRSVKVFGFVCFFKPAEAQEAKAKLKDQAIKEIAEFFGVENK